MLKRLTSLGFAAAVISGCSQPSVDAGKPQSSAAETAPVKAADTAKPSESVAGESGAGESGEGGVDVAAAATDPIVYLSALAVTEAHIHAAKGALAAGQSKAAGEMFAHPVTEVLLDLEPTFKVLGVAIFDSALSDASAAVFDKKPQAEIEAKADAILETLAKAGEKAPKTALPQTVVLTSVILDQIDRAAQQYATAQASAAYEPYLDGYGFMLTAKAWRTRNSVALSALTPQQREGLDAAIKELEIAYPSALRPTTLSADPAALLAAGSKARLAL